MSQPDREDLGALPTEGRNLATADIDALDTLALVRRLKAANARLLDWGFRHSRAILGASVVVSLLAVVGAVTLPRASGRSTTTAFTVSPR